MKMINGTTYIQGVTSTSPCLFGGSYFNDEDNNRIMIDNKTIIRLYELIKNEHEKFESDFDEYCKELFEK